MIPSTEKAILEQFVSEHAKRDRHVPEAEERQAAVNLMRNFSRFEWYRKQFTPAARMAHERELLAIVEAYKNSRISTDHAFKAIDIVTR